VGQKLRILKQKFVARNADFGGYNPKSATISPNFGAPGSISVLKTPILRLKKQNLGVESPVSVLNKVHFWSKILDWGLQTQILRQKS